MEPPIPIEHLLRFVTEADRDQFLTEWSYTYDTWKHTLPDDFRELLDQLDTGIPLKSATILSMSGLDELPTLERVGTDYVRYVVDRAPTKEHAAKILGINPATLYRHQRGLTNKLSMLQSTPPKE